MGIRLGVNKVRKRYYEREGIWLFEVCRICIEVVFLGGWGGFVGRYEERVLVEGVGEGEEIKLERGRD